MPLVAGIPIAKLESKFPKGARVWRAMPNLPAVVDAAATAIACGEGGTEEDEQQVRAILGAVGEVTRIDENLMDAVTGLSGSGPAYVFLFTECLAKAAITLDSQ